MYLVRIHKYATVSCHISIPVYNAAIGFTRRCRTVISMYRIRSMAADSRRNGTRRRSLQKDPR